MRPYEGEGQRTPADLLTSASILSVTWWSMHAHATRGVVHEEEYRNITTA